MPVFSDFVKKMSLLIPVVLIPILVLDGRGYGPLVASWFLVPGPSLGLFIPIFPGLYSHNTPPY
jgi:hypothetical protein